MSRFDLSGAFELDGQRFAWVVKHYAGMSNADATFRGVSARVTLEGGQFRELILDFDLDDYPGQRVSAPATFEARVREETAKAIEEGWRPESRGKPFRFAVPKREGRR